MKALLIDKMHSETELLYRNIFESLTLPILNTPLIGYQMEQLKSAGFNEIVLITKQNIPAELSDGKRWNIKLKIVDRLTSDSLAEWEKKEPVFIMPANMIHNMDIKAFLISHIQNGKDWSAAIPVSASQTGSFNPLLCYAADLREIRLQNIPDLTDYFTAKLSSDSEDIHRVQIKFDTHQLTSYQEYWELHTLLLSNADQASLQPGFPLNDNVWIDKGSRLHSSAAIEGQTVIGKGSKIHSDVELKGFVVIGDNVVIDRKAKIENSIIMNDTYIGSDILVKNSVVRQNFFYQTEKGIGIEIDEKLFIAKTRNRWIA